MWGITSTNGDGGLIKATVETVDGSRLDRFFVKVVPLGDCSGVKKISVCSCWCQDAFELVLMVTPSAWICWDKRCRYCHKTMDNLEHNGKLFILPTMLKSRPLQLLNHHWHAALLSVVTRRSLIHRVQCWTAIKTFNDNIVLYQQRRLPSLSRLIEATN